jgi:hypothetical protein
MFKPWGWMYRPTSVVGWVVSLLVLAFCVHVFLWVDARSHSVSDTFYGVFPFIVPAVTVWYVVAMRTSCRRG